MGFISHCDCVLLTSTLHQCLILTIFECQPFSSHHSPHTIPENVPGFSPKIAAAEKLESSIPINQNQYNAVHLLDHNIAYLIEQLVQAGLFDESIFVFFADHRHHR